MTEDVREESEPVPVLRLEARDVEAIEEEDAEDLVGALRRALADPGRYPPGTNVERIPLGTVRPPEEIRQPKLSDNGLGTVLRPSKATEVNSVPDNVVGDVHPSQVSRARRPGTRYRALAASVLAQAVADLGGQGFKPNQRPTVRAEVVRWARYERTPDDSDPKWTLPEVCDHLGLDLVWIRSRLLAMASGAETPPVVNRGGTVAL